MSCQLAWEGLKWMTNMMPVRNTKRSIIHSVFCNKATCYPLTSMKCLIHPEVGRNAAVFYPCGVCWGVASSPHFIKQNSEYLMLCGFGANAVNNPHDLDHSMFNTHHCCISRMLMNVEKGSCLQQLVIVVPPSIITDTSFSNTIFFSRCVFSHHNRRVVVVFRGSNMRHYSLNTTLMNTSAESCCCFPFVSLDTTCMCWVAVKLFR